MPLSSKFDFLQIQMEQGAFLNIKTREVITDMLHRLRPDSQALFGTMTAQHMVEHLYLTVQLSTGERGLSLVFPTEKAERMKEVVIHTDHPLSLGFKSPIMPSEGLRPLMNKDLTSAIGQLESSLDDFENYFERNKSAKLLNPSFGELGYEEWLVFHNKHFTHHFKQFGLL